MAFTLPPSGPAAAVHLTTVVRLPATVTAALAPTLDRLRAVGPRHHYYPPETMHVTGLAGGHDRGRLARGLGHANLVRFSGPVTAGFLAELARLRRQDFGTFTVDEVELVRTDRLLSPEGTTTLGRLRLEGRAG